MLDGVMRRLIDRPLDEAGRRAAAHGIGANLVTLFGLGAGLSAALCIAAGQFVPALLLLAVSRLADGLDGAVARATTGPTAFGGFLDIVCDFAFYGAVPLAFIVLDPAGNAFAGGLLLASFYVNGATFLAFAVLAQRAGLESQARGRKTLYFTDGLFEGTETILFFAAFMLLPSAFPVLATVFALGCLYTAAMRSWRAYSVFGRKS